MIPQANIQAWREHAPWPNPAQVEQDLIICRALCDLFNAPALAGKIAFRGGTAIHKLLFKQPLRYSEDIDLVQTQAEPIGPTVDAIRLNHYLAIEDHPISRAEAEERMLKKLARSLREDIEPLLPLGVTFDEALAIDAFNDVWSTLIARFRGDAWKLTAQVVAQLRAAYPRLLT